jgi:NAD(P)H-hydrate epimerase
MDSTLPSLFRSLTRSEVRDIDRTAMEELGIPGLLLMENAARGATELLKARNPVGRIVILCGPGNNGGDGMAIARLLAAEGTGAETWLVPAGKSLSADAAANLAILQNSKVPVFDFDEQTLQSRLLELNHDDWIVDALLGTGMTGEIRAPFKELIPIINQSKASVLAVDLPSGLDCDTGIPLGCCVRASLTATFVAGKTGLDSAAAAEWTGEVCVCHIGIPRQWLNHWYSRTHAEKSGAMRS